MADLVPSEVFISEIRKGRSGDSVKLRQVTIGGTVGVDIRNFYTEKETGKEIPTKKGIFIPINMWLDFQKHIMAIGVNNNTPTEVPDNGGQNPNAG